MGHLDLSVTSPNFTDSDNFYRVMVNDTSPSLTNYAQTQLKLPLNFTFNAGLFQFVDNYSLIIDNKTLTLTYLF